MAPVGSRTGRPPRSFWLEPAANSSGENGRGGKSELRRAVCRITSGTPGSSPADGKCHRKHTAPSILGGALQFALSRMGGVRVKRCGKSAPPLQQWRGQGKPHTEQDQIGRKSRPFWLSHRSSAKAVCAFRMAGAAKMGGTRAGSARQTFG
jgi:hypothetical protein